MHKLRFTIPSLQEIVRKLIAVPCVLVDQNGTFLEANGPFIAMSGRTIGQGTAFGELFPDEASAAALYARCVEHAGDDGAVTVAFDDGSGVLRQVRCSIACAESDAHKHYLLTFHDEQPAGGLNLLQQFAGTFMKDVNLGVLLVDHRYTLVDISDTACHILGVKRHEVINRPMEEVFHAVPNEHQLVQRTILDGVLVRNHAVSWTNNRERYELLMDSNLLKDEAGNVVGAYVIFKDVTNLRSLEQQVQRSDRLAMIGQIAAGTAHEIRNPLTSIKGFLQVLHRTFVDNAMEKEQGYTKLMLAEIDRINELVNEFLLLSKPKNVSYDKIDVSAVLRDILPIINNQAVLHNVSIEYQSAYQIPKVVADRELLKQVFINLCKNGIEAMVEGGTLTISERVDYRERKVNVDIQDNGPGIPPFLIDKIFDPFFTTKENGTGLGLSVCQRIIHDLGGSIRVSSKGYGTTFTVSIPFSPN